jgi:penicillin-binding protein 2
VTTSGTAALTAQLGLGPIKMAGKTGTAQGYNYVGGHGVHGTQGAWKLRDHAWFVAFAPYDDPRYAVSVLVEHGGFGAQAAAPRAREIMRVALLKDPEVRKRVVAEPNYQPPPAPTAPDSGDVVPDLPPAPISSSPA